VKPSGFASCRISGASCTRGALHTPRGVLHIRLTTWPAIASAKAAEALLRNMKQFRFGLSCHSLGDGESV